MVAAFVLLVAACGGAEPGVDTTAPPTTSNDQASASGCADVEAVRVTPEDGTYRFDVTVRSADTGDEKYADRWEVRDPDGQVLGTRVLTHPHVNEQPFTRSLTGVDIPPGIGEVVVAAHDSVEGFCGAEATVAIP